MKKAKKYFDMNGLEIKENMYIAHIDEPEKHELVYKSNENDLGLNASNEKYVGFDPLFRELYPLCEFDMREWFVVQK